MATLSKLKSGKWQAQVAKLEDQVNTLIAGVGFNVRQFLRWLKAHGFDVRRLFNLGQAFLRAVIRALFPWAFPAPTERRTQTQPASYLISA